MVTANKSEILDELIESSTNDSNSKWLFREDSSKVGVVYTMFYNRATVAIYDYDREKVGGLPKGGFLIAAKKSGDEGFVLLRILKEARLPNAIANDQTRQQGVESTSNEEPWADALDPWTKNQVSLHAVECRILGTFIDERAGKRRYAEDTDNYFAVNELMVWKPGEQTLHLIVNYQHRTNPIVTTQMRTPIGRTRFSAAERGNATSVDVLLAPTDLLQRRTVYLGMSRSGKSNAMKITAQAIYRLRETDSTYRIGQLVFDPNGEYAQDNPQDGPGLHRVHESLGLRRNDEVETYGLFKPPSDPNRKIMKINFFGDPIPSNWTTSDVETALDQMLAGREIVQEIMAEETARYTTAFRDADLSVPLHAAGNKSIQIRYRRAVLVHQTALAAAGLAPPPWKPSVNGLFGKGIIDAMKVANNQSSDNKTAYDQAAKILETSKTAGGSISWDQLQIVFSALDSFVRDRKSNYAAFEDQYIASSTTKDTWADVRLRNLVRIFEYQNGPRSFQRAQEQHDPNAPRDYAESVVEDLLSGKLVIVDQSTGDPEQNRKASERIMWGVFRAQQEAFRMATSTGSAGDDHKQILVYVEEAHNLLPRISTADNLRTVWARSAKEGSKMNIGMVLATQAPSSIMPEILSETDNWILSYLNSEKERNVIAGYMDFEDFLEQIGQVSEAGFVRMRTLSLAYTVPVQFARFRLDLPVS